MYFAIFIAMASSPPARHRGGNISFFAFQHQNNKGALHANTNSDAGIIIPLLSKVKKAAEV